MPSARPEPALLAAMLLCACGGDPCGDNEADESVTAPRITTLTMLRDAVPDDPWELVFVAAFTDADGDLGSGGAAGVFLNGGAPTTLALRDLFRQGGLALDAERGELQMALRFGDTVPDGADVTMGVQLTDAAQQHSNCFSLDLHFEVRDVR